MGQMTGGNGEIHVADDGMPADLPPVEPPSAGFIVQLFVIPAAIVGVVVVVWLLFGRLAGGERDAMDYVRAIQDPNQNRRWRAAFELGSLIHNDGRLARDPALLGALTDVLDRELARPDGDAQVEQYLAVALGAFQTLDAQAPGAAKAEPLAALARALGADRPTPLRLAAAVSLARQAARLDDTLDDAGAVSALAEATRAEDAGLREAAIFALGFFGGEPAAAALRQRLASADPFVRYNAAFPLVRRGDEAALAVVREMLSPRDLQNAVPRALAPDAQNEARTKLESIELEALKALEVSVRQGHPQLAREVRPAVVEQSRSGLVSVRNEANAVLKSLQGIR